MRVTHCFINFRSMGGVEAVVRGHWQHDADYGINSRFIIYAEPCEPCVERVEFLDLTENSSIKEARHAFSRAIEKQNPEICVYHSEWLLKYFMDLDRVQRRIVLIHGAPRDYPQVIGECEPWADALAAVSQPQYEKARATLPQLGAERIQLLDCPIFPPASQPEHRPLNGRAIVIGYCGRIATDAKRVDRAPAFLEALNQSGLDYRMEFLGDGLYESELKRLLAGNPRVVFHGKKSGVDYWNILREWDAFILFSDSEGTPISILETMDQGVLPIMPGINTGADYYARKLGERFVYPAYDFSMACDTLQWLAKLPQQEIDAMQRGAHEIVAAHRPEKYFQNFAAMLRRIMALPRRSSAISPSRPWPLNAMSFRQLAVLNQIRNRLKR